MRQLSLLQSAIDSCYKLRQLFYYKERHGLLQIAMDLLQIATGITKCDDYYKLRQYKCSFQVICSPPVVLHANGKLPDHGQPLLCIALAVGS